LVAVKGRLAAVLGWLLAASVARAADASTPDKEEEGPERSPASPDEATAGGPATPSAAKEGGRGGEEPSQGPEHNDACIDENIRADLFAKRRIRTTRDRLFQQTNRHELTLQGGYYVSDLFDGTYTYGGAYTYHMTEDLAVEASGGYTNITSSGGAELERTFRVLEGKPRRQLTFDTDLVWVPAHAKMRLGGAITHLDLYLALGGGIVDSVLSSDLAGNGGIGMKFFLGHALAIRFDLRDHVFRQQLLAEKVFVNDLTATLGFSLYLPLEE
jgi:outer membrane beta-barrel protein